MDFDLDWYFDCFIEYWGCGVCCRVGYLVRCGLVYFELVVVEWYFGVVGLGVGW